MAILFNYFLRVNKSYNKNRLFYIFSQFLNANLHPAKSKPFLSQVFQRGTEVIYRVVDTEEVFCEEVFFRNVVSIYTLLENPFNAPKYSASQLQCWAFS